MDDSKQLLDWLEVQGVPGHGWVARHSSTGRGYRLHQTTDWPGSPTARGAIREAMAKAADNWRLCAHVWDRFLADGRIPYFFCHACKSTLYQGLVHPLECKGQCKDA